MRILWIEDGGANLNQRSLALELFSGIVSNNALDDEYDIDKDIWTELPRVFKQFSCHRIFVCRSYLDWKATFESEGGDFDLVLIDINLEAYKTPPSDRPIEHKDFDKSAGLYIYNQLLRGGFPEDHIAIFTGEADTIKRFSTLLQQVLLIPPTHTFEKQPKGYKAAAAWIEDRVSRPYNILRRGIIDGCKFASVEINTTLDEDLEQRLLFYKTTYENVDIDPEHYKDEVQSYLNRLSDFFPLQEPLDKTHRFYRFVGELAGEWSQSTGNFVRQPKFKSFLEEFFYCFSHRFMCLLRDSINRQVASRSLSEREIAFFFMIAMRAWIRMDFDHVQEYEAYLQNLFNHLTDNELECQFNGHLERKLSRSMMLLAKEVDISTESAHSLVFLDYLYAFGTIPDKTRTSKRLVQKKLIREHSSKLLYQAFWHGICPSWIHGPNVNIDIAELQNSNKSNLARYLAALTYNDAFPDSERWEQETTMTPNTFFKKENIPFENSHVVALFPASAREVYDQCIEKIATTLQWKCQGLEVPGDEGGFVNVWSCVKMAELIIFDVSEAPLESMFHLGLTLTVKQEECTLVICQASKLRAIDFLADNINVEVYDMNHLNKLEDKIIKIILSIERKRKGTAEVPSFKHMETKRIFETAVKARQKKDWDTADLLFREANTREPNNWCISMQLGVLYRDKCEWEDAERQFQIAADMTRFDDEKSHIFIERAIMYQKADRINDADLWFQQAAKADKKNANVYFAWAKFWDEAGNAQRAAEKIWHILNNIDDNNQDAKNRIQYYTQKAMDPCYRKSFKEFMDALDRKRHSPTTLDRNSEPKRPSHHQNQDDILKNGVGSIVSGIVNNIVSFGMFLTLSRDLNGLLHQSRLPHGWERMYARGQRVKVRITRIEDKPGGGYHINLEPVYGP